MLVSSIILLLLRHISPIKLAPADTLEQSCANFEILCKIAHYVNDNNDDGDDDVDDGDSEYVL